MKGETTTIASVPPVQHDAFDVCQRQVCESFAPTARKVHLRQGGTAHFHIFIFTPARRADGSARPSSLKEMLPMPYSAEISRVDPTRMLFVISPGLGCANPPRAPTRIARRPR
jgi:hypothetical protein